MKVFAAVVSAYDTVGAAAKTLYFATKGFASTAADTPAHTPFIECMLQPATMRRDALAPGTTMGASKVGVGHLVLDNSDGSLDYLLDYAFDGRAITDYMADAEGTVFPGGYEVLTRTTMEQAEFSLKTVTLRLCDRQLELEVPLQPTPYAGDNVLPAGLEGVEDLKGKPKPLAFGVVRNVSPPCVNTSKLIYQVSDGAVASIDGVYDSGMLLSAGTNFSWVRHSLIRPMSMNGVVWAERHKLFVAFGVLTGSIATSPDGEVWTYREVPGMYSATAPASTLTLEGLEWSEDAGLFVAVGNTGAGGTGKIFVSADGIVWVEKVSTSATANHRLLDAAYSPTLDMWVVTGEDAHIETSTDMDTWTARVSAFTATSEIYGICWSPDEAIFVAVGSAGEINTSPDGVNWNLEAGTSFGATWIGDVAWNARLGLFAAVGESGKIGTSPDGVAWTDRVSPVATNLNNVIATAYGFIAVGNSCRTVISEDGITWVLKADFDTGGRSARGVAVGGGRCVVINSNVESNVSMLVSRIYVSEADLLDDARAPDAGGIGIYLAGGYVRLGSTPFGLVTADVTQGAAAANRTAAQGWKWALEAAGMTVADWSAADIAALDVANNAEVGYWSGLQPVTCATVASLMTGSVGAWWGVDRTGIYRTAVLGDPTGEAADVSFIEEQLVKDLERIATADPGRGVPIWRYVVRYSKNYTPQAEVAASVSDARRADLALPWREELDEDAAVKMAYLLAREQVDESLLAYQADALAEATRRLALRKVRRDRFEFVVALDADSIQTDLGSFVELTHGRFGLTAGKVFCCITVEPDAVNEVLTLGLWG